MAADRSACASSGSPARWCVPCVAALVTLGATATALAQPSDPFTMPAVKVVSPPSIDGVVDNDEWRTAARVADFIQFEPNRGDPARLETAVWVLYDDTHLYVAFEAHDPEPLMAQMTQRDAQLWNDDSVQIYIDTFHDGRSGYFFMANVLGTQLDGRLPRTATPATRPGTRHGYRRRS